MARLQHKRSAALLDRQQGELMLINTQLQVRALQSTRRGEHCCFVVLCCAVCSTTALAWGVAGHRTALRWRMCWRTTA